MSDMMTFPDTWEEFEKSYGFTDSEEVYTNGSRLIPSFRVKQWLDHLSSAQPDVPDTNVGEWIPVSERLPVIYEYDVNGMKTFSCRVLSTQVYGNGLVFVGLDKYTNGGSWLSEVLDENDIPVSKVIAWMPLPDPYKEDLHESKSDNTD